MNQEDKEKNELEFRKQSHQYKLIEGGRPGQWIDYVLISQSTEINPFDNTLLKFERIDPKDDMNVNPEGVKDMFLEGPSIPMEVVESQEEGKKAVKVKPRSEIDLRSLAEKEAFYKLAIDKDTKLIANVKERIKYNKIRLRKLEQFLDRRRKAEEKMANEL